MGSLKDQYDIISGIHVSKHVVKCQGIYQGHDETECYTKNWIKVYHDIIKLNIDIRFISITSEISIKKFDIVQKLPQFYKEVFSCFNICKTRPEFKTTEWFLKQPIWSNNPFAYKGKTVCFKSWIKSGILLTKHLFNINGKLKSLDDLSTVIQNKSNWLC